jgi:hypothetical protein
MAAACSLAVISGGVNALAVQNQGSLRGRVTDQLGGLVVGATVALVAGDGEEKTAVTDSEGGYVVSGLAPGKYTVRANAAGFALYEQPEVAIAGGRAETLDIKLSVREVTGDVTVSTGNGGSLGTDADNSASTLVLRGSDLDILPDDPEQMAADLRMLGGPSEGPDGTQILVDGFSGSRIPPKSSIREVRISSDPYSASQDFYGFGRVEIITKPGSSKFNGSGFFNYNDRNLNARNPVAVSDTPFLMRFYGGNVSGPIFGNRGSYFLDFTRRDVDESLPINALTLDPALNVVRFDEVFPIALRRTGYSGRFDYQLSKDNTLVARYEYSRTGYTGGLGDLSLPSRAFPVRLSDHTLQLTETAILSPSALNETRFQFRRSNVAREGRSDEATINVQGAFVGGGPQVGDELNRTNSYDLTNTTTWTRSTHTWRAGARLRYSSINDISATNFGGTFVFSSLDQYRDVLLGVPGARPVQFTLAAGNPEARLSQLDFGGFVQDDWKVRQNFTLSYGLRYEAQSNIGDKVDLAPRLSFAWAPGTTAAGKTPKTVLRGGAGIFYLRFGENLTLDSLRYNGLNQRQFIVDNPDFFPLVPTGDLIGGALPTTVRRTSPDVKSPYIVGTSFSAERQLPRNTTVSLTYIFKGARQLLRSRNINAPLPGSGVRPLGGEGNIFVFESGGIDNDHTVVFSFNSRPSTKLSLFSRLGWSHEKNNTEGPYSFSADPYSFDSEYADALNDRRVFFTLGANYNGPWGLSFSPSLFALTPGRFNIITGVDSNGDGVFTERPAFADDLSKPGVVRTRFGDFDPNPGPGQQIIPRNFGEGARLLQVNLRVTKTFRFGDMGKAAGGGQGSRPPEKRFSLATYAQVQNLLNTTNRGAFIGNLGSPRFGEAFGITNFPRRIEAGVRLSF